MDELCKICERVSFGTVVRLGFGHWRHEDCQLGSEAWACYYQRLALTQRSTLTEFYNFVKDHNTGG